MRSHVTAVAFHAIAFHHPTHPPKHKHDSGSEHGDDGSPCSNDRSLAVKLASVCLVQERCKLGSSQGRVPELNSEASELSSEASEAF